MARAIVYRVTVFGTPRGPWRFDKLQARRDAIALGLGNYDEYRRFFITVPADIEWQEVTVASIAA